jgi:hypothetical protein
MALKSHHVVPHDGDWAVRRNDSERVSRQFDNKQDAIDWARDQSRQQGTELFIHNRDGRISQRDSHGHDPRESKG